VVLEVGDVNREHELHDHPVADSGHGGQAAVGLVVTDLFLNRSRERGYPLSVLAHPPRQHQDDCGLDRRLSLRERQGQRTHGSHKRKPSQTVMKRTP